MFFLCTGLPETAKFELSLPHSLVGLGSQVPLFCFGLSIFSSLLETWLALKEISGLLSLLYYSWCSPGCMPLWTSHVSYNLCRLVLEFLVHTVPVIVDCRSAEDVVQCWVATTTTNNNIYVYIYIYMYLYIDIYIHILYILYILCIGGLGELVRLVRPP